MQDKAKQKLELMKGYVDKFKYKTPAIEMFLEETKCHKSTAYDYYLMVTKGVASKRVTNAKLRRNYNKLANKDKCYLCGNHGQGSHHFDYLKNKTFTLCQSCHSKIHVIFKFYHETIIDTDRILTQIKTIINDK